MLSQPPNQSPQPLVRDQFSNWLEVLSFLFKTKQGRRIIGLLLGFLGVVTLILGIVTYKALQLMRPEKIEVTTGLGTISIKSGDTQNAVFLLSPNGRDENTPWVRTGIKVTKGDVIKITASGRVNTSIKRVVATTIRPEVDERTWVGPSGLEPSQNQIYYSLYDQFKLLPDKDGAYYGFGMLLAAVKDSAGRIKTEDIAPFTKDNGFIEFTAKKDGELVLTVNDIWLSGDKKNVYVPPFNDDNFQHYLQLAKFEAAFREDFNSWLEGTKRKKAEEQYQKRLKGWEAINEEKNWNIWYDDNIGAFSVSITINPETK